MKHTRIIVTHYGEPEALQVIAEECPEPKDGEVRVRVLAAGVALPDLLARGGVHPETPKVPFTPGWDLVGLVDRLGSGVSGIEAGQTVAAMPISGAYAEFVCLPERELVAVPSGLDAAEAVSLVLNYITAWVVPYSIQTFKRMKPELFRQDLIALLDLLQPQKIKPLIARRSPLAEARHALELLGKGGVDRQDRARARRVHAGAFATQPEPSP